MKHKIIFSILGILFFFIETKGQSLFEDALMIRRNIDNATGKFDNAGVHKDTIIPILQGRYFNGQKFSSYADIDSAVTIVDGDNENPYLHTLIPPPAGAITKKSFPSVAKGFLSSVGGVDVTVVADALARFMVKRAKQELTINFFEQFKNDLNDPRLSDLRILFPTTFKALMVFDKEIYQYAAYLNTLREAFDKDISQLNINLIQVWDQPKYLAFFNSKPEILEALKMVNELSSIMIHGEHPGDAIHELADLNSGPITNVSVANYKNTIRLLDLFSQSFRTSAADKYWVSSTEILKLSSDPILRKIFLGLLLQKEKEYNIEFIVQGRPYYLRKLMIEHAEAILTNQQELMTYVYKLVPKIQAVEYRLNLVKQSQAKGKVDSQLLYDLFESFLSLTEHTLEIDRLTLIKTHIPGFKIPQDVKTVVYVGRLINETYIDVARKNYNSAIVNGAMALDTVLGMLNLDDRKPVLKDLLSAFTTNNNSTTLNGHVDPGNEEKIFIVLKQILDATSNNEKRNAYLAYEKLKPLIMDDNLEKIVNEYVGILITDKGDSYRKLIRYGTFAANIANAKDAEEAEAAIEAIALPSGSARVKKEMAFSISLNSYLGGFFGTNGFTNMKDKTSYGVTGLVGIGFNLGTKNKNPWSFSLYGSVIDIGALAAFRINNDTSEYKFKVKLNQIVSPGAFLIVGFPKYPLSFIAGYQYAPFISSVNSEEYKINSNRGRVTVGLAVDIPILHLYNKPKK